MREKILTVSNRAGLHARPAAMLVQAIKDFTCEIYLEKDQNQIKAKSIMGVITLGAAYGSAIKVTTDGEDEEQAMDVITQLFESKFEEE
ncbi:MAG: HPr family phosphocarrier protein [Spirochaetaceae bacterium]|jgi:phosphocarrier protein|nr:HPr family phosphocarrier protein [Spirochaetaceae bacterium]